ncbi:MAG: dihydrofolate reductase family protein, partial [Rhodococcus fascians]
KNVAVAGGGTLLRQVIAVGLLHQLELHIAPVILGDGMRLLDHRLELDTLEGIELTPEHVTATNDVTHIRYRVRERRPLVLDNRGRDGEGGITLRTSATTGPHRHRPVGGGNPVSRVGERKSWAFATTTPGIRSHHDDGREGVGEPGLRRGFVKATTAEDIEPNRPDRMMRVRGWIGPRPPGHLVSYASPGVSSPPE